MEDKICVHCKFVEKKGKGFFYVNSTNGQKTFFCRKKCYSFFYDKSAKRKNLFSK